MHPPHTTPSTTSGIIVVSASGKVFFANGRAKTLLTFHFPACIGTAPWSQRLRQWIAQSAPAWRQTRGTVSAPLRSERDGRRLLIRVIETRLEKIFLLDEVGVGTNSPNRGVESLLRLGVTARESEVLRWLVEGKSNPEISVILHIALRTVKKHLEHIFEKLGVENRTCAAARASEVLHRPGSVRVGRRRT